MENQSLSALFRIPTPSKQSLSFCNATPRDLKLWLSNLPKANIGETARQLYQGLIELNNLDIPADERLRLVELIRTDIYLICRNLERYFLNKSVALDERARKVAHLCQALQSHLSNAYKLIIKSTLDSPARDKQHTLTIAIQRALHSIGLSLVKTCQLYSPVPEGLWFDLHQLYQLARANATENTAVRDDLARHSDNVTIAQTYSASLLLGCAQTNQMRQSQIAPLAEILEAWSLLLKLQPAQQPSSLYVVSPNKDAAPRYRTFYKSEELAGMIGLDTQQLIDAIEQHILLADHPQATGPLTVPDGFNLDLLQHLSAAWGEIAERTFQRSPCSGSLSLCIGMSAAHFYLAGEQSFSDFLKTAQHPRQATFKQHNVTDIWSGAFDAQPANWEEGLAITDIVYSTEYLDPKAQSESSPQDLYPIYQLPLINQSPGGYCLAWQNEVPTQMQAGELLVLQDGAGSPWRVAMIRWIRQVRGGSTQMGVELIAPSAQPCGLKLLRKDDGSSQYLRALMLPAVEAISRPAQLITPRLPFTQGSKVQININGAESKAILGRRQATSVSFNQFEFQLIGASAHQPNAPENNLSKAQSPSTEDDFASLWNSL